jgi:hypothetical protein
VVTSFSRRHLIFSSTTYIIYNRMSTKIDHISVNSNIIKHADYFGTPEALIEFPDFLKGNKNRARSLTRFVEQKRALDAQNDLVLDALNCNKRTALKIHKDFCPGDKNRSHKLTRILKIKIDKNNAMLKAVAKLKLPVEVSASELNGWVKDTSRTLRRRANEPLPCRIQRQQSVKIPFYLETNEIDCNWVEQLLRGDRPDDIHPLLDDRLVPFPASIKGELCINNISRLNDFSLLDFGCPQLKELWRYATASHVHMYKISEDKMFTGKHHLVVSKVEHDEYFGVFDLDSN